jgi:hypothetical protein
VFVLWLVLAPPVRPKTDRPHLSSSSFEQQISHKLHNPLVVRTKSSTAQTRSNTPLPPCDTTLISSKIQSAFPSASVTAPPCHESKCHDVIVAGSAHKNAILDAYEAKYKSGTDHVVTRIKGKRVLDAVLNPCKRMRPSSDKYYRVKELTLYNVITTVVKELYSSFSQRDLLNLATINKDFSVMIPNVARWLKIDFKLLREPRFDYENQLEVSHHQTENGVGFCGHGTLWFGSRQIHPMVRR